MTLRVGRLDRMWLPRVGGFVWTPDEFGIGKFLELRDGRAMVEIRRSVVVSESHEYAPTDLRHAYLPLQSRVYHQRHGSWYLGRVLDRYVDSSNTSYLVKFPGFQPIEAVSIDAFQAAPSSHQLGLRCESGCAETCNADQVTPSGPRRGPCLSQTGRLIHSGQTRGRRFPTQLLEQGGLHGRELSATPHCADIGVGR